MRHEEPGHGLPNMPSRPSRDQLLQRNVLQEEDVVGQLREQLLRPRLDLVPVGREDVLAEDGDERAKPRERPEVNTSDSLDKNDHSDKHLLPLLRPDKIFQRKS